MADHGPDEQALMAQLSAAIAATESHPNDGRTGGDDTAMVDPSLLGEEGPEFDHTDHHDHHQQHHDDSQGQDSADLSNIEAVLASLLTAGVPQEDESRATSHEGSPAPSRTHGHGDTDMDSGLSIAETLAITRSNMQRARDQNKDKIDPMLNRKHMFQSSHYSAKVHYHQRPRTQVSSTPVNHTTTKFHVYTPDRAPGKVKRSQAQTTFRRKSRAPTANGESGDANDTMESLQTLFQALQQESGDNSGSSSQQQVVTKDSSNVNSGEADESMLAALLLARQMFADEEATKGPDDKEDSGKSGMDEPDSELSADAIDAVQQALQALGKSLDEETRTKDTNRVIAQAKRIRSAMLSPEKREKIRLDNRTRKQKWRGQNNSRNKDNDLRVRVNRRANILFGPEPSEQKSQWIDTEYHKRRQRRMAKEMGTYRTDPQPRTLPARMDQPPMENGSDDDGSDMVRAMFESLKNSDTDLTEAINTLSKDATLLRSLNEVFGAEQPSTSAAMTSTASASGDDSRPAKRIRSEPQDSEVYIKQEPDAPPSEIKWTSEFTSALAAAFSPPKYMAYGRPSFDTSSSLPSRMNGSPGFDSRVNALGFPPIVNAMALRRL
uniref:ARAD1B12584p n=1 Tax=Blastobotrys adeninivorans TaxID=409370 RepID=A0A060T5L3_BLAAD